MMPCVRGTQVDTILHLPGFYGDISTAAAEAAVKANAHKGAYLIRFSATAGSYAITLLNKKGTLEHYRVSHNAGTPYVMAKTSFDSLPLLLKNTKDELFLKSPLTGGPFERLFQAHAAKYQHSDGYIVQDL
jgi:hypothetical protein